MPKFAANIDWLFTEVPFVERFGAAAAAGFNGVEFLFPYAHPIGELSNLINRYKLKNVLFNLYAGDWKAGERGIAALPGREGEFRDSVESAISYALGLGTRCLHVLAGIVPPDGNRGECRDLYLANIRYAANKLAPHGITLLVEAINGYDMPGYLIQNQYEAFDICMEAGAENIKMQLDLYHMQMAEGNLAAGLLRYRSAYAHVQIAGVPGRREPNIGEVNYPYLFSLLDQLGYDGWVGCEYRPHGCTLEGLSWRSAALAL